MDKSAPQTIYLKDYTPPEFLIDTVALDVNLHPTATRVRSRLGIRPNRRAGEQTGALVLDGEALGLDEVRVDRPEAPDGGLRTNRYRPHPAQYAGRCVRT